MDAENEDEAIPFDVKPDTLKKVMVFCEHICKHEEPKIEEPLPSNDLKPLVDEWYFNYITKGVSKEQRFDILYAANLMNIQPLLDLAGAQVATQIKDKPIP